MSNNNTENLPDIQFLTMTKVQRGLRNEESGREDEKSPLLIVQEQPVKTLKKNVRLYWSEQH